MSDLLPIRRALISVSDKQDLVPFARALKQHGVEIISTGGTAAVLQEAGITVIPIEQVTGFPEMMDGRVKTLHPAVHGALLGRRDLAHHLEAMETHSITPIDLVCVNLYPFERTLSEDLSRDEAIELIDIGGPAMIRSAAKNAAFVTVVTSPGQYDRVTSEMQRNDGAVGGELRRDLAAAAFSRTAEYDATISAWMSGRTATHFPAMLRMSQTLQSPLRYGENPHQKAALYHDPTARGADVVSAELLHGKPLSYNNINDGAAAFELVRELRMAFPDKSGAAIIKHTNPCGCAVADLVTDAFELAYAGDPVAAFGGILALNGHVDAKIAERIVSGEKFFEVIIAPGFDHAALNAIGERWKNVRLLATGDIDVRPHTMVEYRSIPGGMLAQEVDQALPSTGDWQHKAGPTPDAATLDDARLLWIAAKHLKSNAVAVGAQGRLFGAGAGQMDRVTASRLAVEKAQSAMKDAAYIIACSDGFFPFPDGPELLIKAGVRMIVHPGGSKRDQDTFDLCDSHGVTCMVAGFRHFKH